MMPTPRSSRDQVMSWAGSAELVRSRPNGLEVQLGRDHELRNLPPVDLDARVATGAAETAEHTCLDLLEGLEVAEDLGRDVHGHRDLPGREWLRVQIGHGNT